jgi:hypothetical protein
MTDRKARTKAETVVGLRGFVVVEEVAYAGDCGKFAGAGVGGAGGVGYASYGG